MARRGFIKYLEIFAVSMSIGALLGYATSFVTEYFHKERKHEIEFSSQLKTLDNVSNNLTTLQKFINDQKIKLFESEKAIKALKEEEKKIKPVIEADRETIEAIFKLQAEISRRNVWFDRGIGFLLGVFSSLFATFIVGFFRNKKSSTP